MPTKHQSIPTRYRNARKLLSHSYSHGKMGSMRPLHLPSHGPVMFAMLAHPAVRLCLRRSPHTHASLTCHCIFFTARTA
eukprot:749833-Hanusia_phi.AAC.1